MSTERKVVLVSTPHENDDVSNIGMVGAHLADGWEVIGTIPLSGADRSPGATGNDKMVRLQVILERPVEEGMVPYTGEKP